MSDLFSEGRVVGLSAYEQYIKQFKETYPEELYPNAQPATEREWLASSLASGSSLLIHVPSSQGTGWPAADPKYYTLDIPLPVDSKLRAANALLGSCFDGVGNLPTGETTFANYVISCNPLLITNPGGLKADSDPYQEAYVINDPSIIRGLGDVSPSMLDIYKTFEKERHQEYMKIRSGVMLQAGTWTKVTTYSAVYDFTPDLDVAPILRLELSAPISAQTSIWILVTGYTDSTVVAGISGIDTSIQTSSPQDGDFLGPAAYPWAAPVTFVVKNNQLSDIIGDINEITISEGTISVS